MNTHLPHPDASYTSPSQQARAMTEQWVAENAYCPACGQPLERLPNNTKAADFVCPSCGPSFELKSKRGPFGAKIVDGSYTALMQRLHSDDNPHLFLMTHNSAVVTSFWVIPKYCFTPDAVEQRPPLAPTARRAGWVGCNIVLERLPLSGRVYYVQGDTIQPKPSVLRQFAATRYLENVALERRSWLMDVMEVVVQLGRTEFSLSEVYQYADHLSTLHPDNHNIEAKIRQQLQLLRDQGQIEFVGRGHYRRVT